MQARYDIKQTILSSKYFHPTYDKLFYLEIYVINYFQTVNTSSLNIYYSDEFKFSHVVNDSGKFYYPLVNTEFCPLYT